MLKRLLVYRKGSGKKNLCPLRKMLDWVANAAHDPHDRAFEASQRSAKWKNYTDDKQWKHDLLARRALFEELSVDSSNETNGLQV